MNATDRFKRLLADALERVCVLEAELEARDATIAELREQVDVEVVEFIPEHDGEVMHR